MEDFSLDEMIKNLDFKAPKLVKPSVSKIKIPHSKDQIAFAKQKALVDDSINTPSETRHLGKQRYVQYPDEMIDKLSEGLLGHKVLIFKELIGFLRQYTDHHPITYITPHMQHAAEMMPFQLRNIMDLKVLDIVGIQPRNKTIDTAYIRTNSLNAFSEIINARITNNTTYYQDFVYDSNTINISEMLKQTTYSHTRRIEDMLLYQVYITAKNASVCIDDIRDINILTSLILTYLSTIYKTARIPKERANFYVIVNARILNKLSRHRNVITNVESNSNGRLHYIGKLYNSNISIYLDTVRPTNGMTVGVKGSEAEASSIFCPHLPIYFDSVSKHTVNFGDTVSIGSNWGSCSITDHNYNINISFDEKHNKHHTVYDVTTLARIISSRMNGDSIPDMSDLFEAFYGV